MEDKYLRIEENIRHIRHEVSEAAVRYGRAIDEIQLMAVTKTVPAHAVNVAISKGIKLLGENRVQELTEKYELYDKENVSIHFIGHLQTNKVRKVVGLVDMIHSVDSLRLATEIDRQAKKLNKIVDVLIEINIAGEISKAGILPGDAQCLAQEISTLSNLRLRGLMTIPPVDAYDLQTERYFSQLQELKLDIASNKLENVKMDVLSMGMSGDYSLAIKHGSTIVRIGSAIFGGRF